MTERHGDTERHNEWARQTEQAAGPAEKSVTRNGDDRIGAVSDLLGTLAGANISVTAIDAVSIGERYGALCWVAPREVKKAAKLLGAL